MKNRFRFFSKHLFISFLIAILTAYLVFNIWYPSPLHRALGVTYIFIIVLIVDALIGPLLTLLVYKTGKKTLVMDLSVIAILQIAALFYGVWTVAEGRPVWLVFGGNHFELIRKIDVEPEHLVRQPSWLGPEWVSIQLPLQLGLTNLFGNNRDAEQSFYRQPSQYQNLDVQAHRIRRIALPMTMLEHNNSTESIASTLKKWPQANGWLGLRGTVQDMVVLVNIDNAEVISIVDLRPWQ